MNLKGIHLSCVSSDREVALAAAADSESPARDGATGFSPAGNAQMFLDGRIFTVREQPRCSGVGLGEAGMRLVYCHGTPRMPRARVSVAYTVTNDI